MIIAIVILLGLTVSGIWMLLHHLEPERDSTHAVIMRIDEILPQTQCRECGYAGCEPYAEAIVCAKESIDRCPPGGQSVQRAIAELLGRPDNASRRVLGLSNAVQSIAVIDEAACIGCTKCIDACPVDAIVGAAKQMHTVIKNDCTGCELCIPPCPVDCIDLVPATGGIEHWRWPAPRYVGVDRRSR